MKKDLGTRIGIIGAGAAGLTAAETLRQKGYTNITILEREGRAGGKCYSIDQDGRSYELGAGIVASNNKTVLRLAQQFGVKVTPMELGKSILLDIQTGQPLPKRSWKENFALFRQLLQYRRLSRQYHHITSPGLENVDPELCVPFSVWAKKHGMKLVQQELAMVFTGFGYGYFDEIPAAYVLKCYPWESIKAFIKRDIFKFPEGIQMLWTAVAKQQTVLYNVSIKKITRAKTITVILENQTLEFDELLIASPLDETSQFMDTSEQEQDLFSQIIHCDYRTFACWLKNFPKKSGYLPGNYSSDRKGHPLFWYLRHPQSNLYTFYVLGDGKMTNEHILKNIKKVIHQLGGQIERIHTIAEWKYFPHVTPEALRSGFFDRIESLQGKRHTYYLGELLNFSTVELSTVYAKQLVERYF